MPRSLHRWSATAAPASVPRLRNQIIAVIALEAPDVPLDDVRLALSEAMTNVVLHAYRGEEPEGTLDVTLEVGPSRIRLRVRDQGIGLGPRVDSPGAGLGLSIISRVAKDLAVCERDRRGTEFSIDFVRLGRRGASVGRRLGVSDEWRRDRRRHDQAPRGVAPPARR